MGVSTFYGYYLLEAMSAAGENGRALSTVRDYWGAMLDMGATSFWEDFNVAWTNNAFRIDEMPVKGKKDVHGDYGEFCYRGFRHSLCHGWSAGPAAWLICHVLGSEHKRAQETASLERSGDSFRKVVVVGVPQPKYTDEKGITYIGILDFLLDSTVLDGLLK